MLTVVAVTDAAHRRDEAGLAGPMRERPRRELGAVVGVDHDFAGDVRVAVGDCHADRVRDQGGVLAVVDGPAHDAPGIASREKVSRTTQQ